MSEFQAIERRYLTDAWRTSDRAFPVRSPIDGATVAEIADLSGDAGRAAAKEAADVAWAAFERWRRTTAFERAEVLRRWHDLMLRDRERLARAMTLEMGKPIKESRGEVAYAAGFVRWYAEEAARVYGTEFPTHAPHKRALALRSPVGPVYAVTPWNFPAAMVTRKAAPALAAGCTFVHKPAEQSPVTALLLAELWREAGGPDGTLQVLPAADPVPLSDVLMADPRIRKITFTGSTEVGRILYRQSAETIKRISLELGGHAPFLVFEDADLDRAVVESIACKFRNAGQTCVCTNRIFVHASVAEPFTERYVAAAEALVLGDPLDEATDVGPLVDEAARGKVERHLEDAVAKGATVRTGGRAESGLRFLPTVLSGATQEMLMMQEETFGPVAPIATFDRDEDAVRMANATPFGLAAYLYTRDLTRAWETAEALDYGIVGVNDGVPSAPYAPFGGTKQSGIGREGGPWGIEEYLETKYVSIGLQRGS